jgi:hypothetical protein
MLNLASRLPLFSLGLFRVLFLFLFLFRAQVIGALAGLTDALEDDVKAGLRTDSRRCAPFFHPPDLEFPLSHPPAARFVLISTGPPARKT